MSMLDYVIHRTQQRREEVRQAVLSGEIPHWLRRLKRFNYVRQVLVSTPPWACRVQLKSIKLLAIQINELTGVEHHICHIVPLNHPRVCGLTVPWNLEIKTAKINLSSGNDFPDENQLQLF
jgi:hypothetical protein